MNIERKGLWKGRLRNRKMVGNDPEAGFFFGRGHFHLDVPSVIGYLVIGFTPMCLYASSHPQPRCPLSYNRWIPNRAAYQPWNQGKRYPPSYTYTSLQLPAIGCHRCDWQEERAYAIISSQKTRPILLSRLPMAATSSQFKLRVL